MSGDTVAAIVSFLGMFGLWVALVARAKMRKAR
jgi:hypothetical protein